MPATQIGCLLPRLNHLNAGKEFDTSVNELRIGHGSFNRSTTRPEVHYVARTTNSSKNVDLTVGEWSADGLNSTWSDSHEGTCRDPNGMFQALRNGSHPFVIALTWLAKLQ